MREPHWIGRMPKETRALNDFESLMPALILSLPRYPAASSLNS